MEKSEGGNFNFPPYNKKLQSDTDTSVTAVVAPASSSSSDVPAAKKLARQLDFTVLGGRGGGVGGGGGGMSATMSTSSVLLQTQQQQQQQQQRVVLPMPRPQAEITTTATAQVALTMPPMLQAQSPHPYTVRPVKPESPKSRPRPNADIKDGTPKRAKQCNCKHSKCLKLYCECFASGIYCDGCNCVNCYNNVENEVARREAVEATLERNPNAFRPKIASSPHGSKDSKVEAGELIILAKHNKGCHCKKSGCLKKYCECFQANILCSDNCKCVECKNQEGSEERQALFRGEHGNNFVYIQQAANAAITGAIGSSGYGSLPVSKKRKAQEALFGTTAKDAHRLAQLQQANHNKGQGHCSTIPNARNGNASSLGHSKFTYRSLLADIIQPQDLTELCSVLVVVSQAAKTLAAQKRVEDERETSLASSIQRKSDNQKETDADKSVTEGFTSRNQDIKSGPDDSSSEGADLPKSRPMSPATLALMCDEQDTMFMAASSRRARGQDRNMPSQSPFDQAMRDVYAEQERIVLTKFRDCLTRLITVGEIKETKCSSLARSEQGNPKEPVNNGVTKPTTMVPNAATSAIAANHSNQHSRSLPPVSENTALKPKIENDV